MPPEPSVRGAVPIFGSQTSQSVLHGLRTGGAAFISGYQHTPSQATRDATAPHNLSNVLPTVTQSGDEGDCASQLPSADALDTDCHAPQSLDAAAFQGSLPGGDEVPGRKLSRNHAVCIDLINTFENVGSFILDENLTSPQKVLTPTETARVRRHTDAWQSGIRFSWPLYQYLDSKGLLYSHAYQVISQSVGEAVYIRPSIDLYDALGSDFDLLWRGLSMPANVKGMSGYEPKDYVALHRTMGTLRQRVLEAANAPKRRRPSTTPGIPGPFAYLVYCSDTDRISIRRNRDDKRTLDYPLSLDLNRAPKRVQRLLKWLCASFALPCSKDLPPNSYHAVRDQMEGVMRDELYHFLESKEIACDKRGRRRVPEASDNGDHLPEQELVASIGPDDSVIDHALPNALHKKYDNLIKDVNRYIREQFGDTSVVLLYSLKNRNRTVLPGKRAQEREADYGINIPILGKPST